METFKGLPAGDKSRSIPLPNCRIRHSSTSWLTLRSGTLWNRTSQTQRRRREICARLKPKQLRCSAVRVSDWKEPIIVVGICKTGSIKASVTTRTQFPKRARRRFFERQIRFCVQADQNLMIRNEVIELPSNQDSTAQAWSETELALLSSLSLSHYRLPHFFK